MRERAASPILTSMSRRPGREPSADGQALSRREFLALSGKGGVAALTVTMAPTLVSPVQANEASPTKLPDVHIYDSATTLAKAIREKQVSSVEVVNACLDRIGAINPKLNAVVQTATDTARQEARAADQALARGEIQGPLHGVPFTVKDNIETAGVICASGTKGRASFVPKEDAVIVARLRAAGGILLGKTNMPELGFGAETDNLVYGRTNNPYDLSRIAGGSSGGEGAIIAAGGSPFGIGNDGGGSIRFPCHCCGIVGIKPTTGRVPKTGHFPGSGGALDTFWQSGPMARRVEDLILALPLLIGPDGKDASLVPMPLGDPKEVKLKKLRVAYYTQHPLSPGMVTPTPATIDTVMTTAKVLADAGMAVEEAQPAGLNQSTDLYFRLVSADGGAGLQALLKEIGTTEYSPLVQLALDARSSRSVTTTEFLQLVKHWDAFRSAMLSFMDQFDVIIAPIMAAPAPPHGVSFDANKFGLFSYTGAYNLTGWPTAAVRAGTSPDGLPIGVQIVARPWREDIALAVAQYIETVLGGWQPPTLWETRQNV